MLANSSAGEWNCDVLANSSAGEWNCDVLDDHQIKRALKGVLELQEQFHVPSAGTCSRRT